MNIVKFDKLKEAKNTSQKSPIIIMDDERTISSSLLNEELSKILSPNNNKRVYGNGIWLQSSQNILGIKFYNSRNTNRDVKNIIEFPFSELEVTYNWLTSHNDINFSTLNLLDNSCYVNNTDTFNKLVITNGNITSINLNNCPSLETIAFDQNTANLEVLDVRNLPNLKSISLSTAGNFIKFILVYNKIRNKFIVIGNISDAEIILSENNNTSDYLNTKPSYVSLKKFYFLNFTGTSFSQEDLDLATSKNIELINVK